ncbi:hypothetical protein [Streptosporangium sp. NPDC000396]|uniref:hypothetical protein n=1 Tax=Streptosporangium sp. NPDC000396 TaxID=3366185 RepID=UPI0036CBDF72
MLVVLALAAVAILAGVVVVAMGRGGEMSEFAPDVPPLDLPDAGRLSAVDFMTLQLPVSLVGYHTQSVDETLSRVANALSERDTRIAVLEQRVSELLASRLQARQEVHAAPLSDPRTEHEPEGPAEPAELSEIPPESLAGRNGDGRAVHNGNGKTGRDSDAESGRNGDAEGDPDGDATGELDGEPARDLDGGVEGGVEGNLDGGVDGDSEGDLDGGGERGRTAVPDVKEAR